MRVKSFRKLLSNLQNRIRLKVMRVSQGICIMAMGLLACSQEAPIHQNVKVQRGEIVQRQAAVEKKPFIEELPAPKQVPEVPEPPVVAKPKNGEVGSVLVGSHVGGESTDPVQQPKAGKPPAPPVELAPLGKIGEYTVVGFDRLASFAYEVPDDPITEPKAKAIIEKNVIPEIGLKTRF